MKEFKKYGVYAALLFVIVAFIMLFLQGGIVPKEILGWKLDNSSIFDVIFGQNNRLDPKLNILAFVSLLLLVVGAVVSFLSVLPPNVRYGSAGILLIISGIFFFIIPYTITLDNIRSVVLGTPLILAGVFTLLAGVINGSLAILEVLKK